MAKAVDGAQRSHRRHVSILGANVGAGSVEVAVLAAPGFLRIDSAISRSGCGREVGRNRGQGHNDGRRNRGRGVGKSANLVYGALGGTAALRTGEIRGFHVRAHFSIIGLHRVNLAADGDRVVGQEVLHAHDRVNAPVGVDVAGRAAVPHDPGGGAVGFVDARAGVQNLNRIVAQAVLARDGEKVERSGARFRDDIVCCVCQCVELRGGADTHELQRGPGATGRRREDAGSKQRCACQGQRYQKFLCHFNVSLKARVGSLWGLTPLSAMPPCAQQRHLLCETTDGKDFEE
jgi:hypothetical protein